jgi:hypothetical protein
MATLPVFHHEPYDPHKPERIAPSRVAYLAYESHMLYEVWQKSGKELVPRSDLSV